MQIKYIGHLYETAMVEIWSPHSDVRRPVDPGMAPCALCTRLISTYCAPRLAILSRIQAVERSQKTPSSPLNVRPLHRLTHICSYATPRGRISINDDKLSATSEEDGLQISDFATRLAPNIAHDSHRLPAKHVSLRS